MKIDKSITDAYYNIISTYCKFLPYEGEHFFEFRITEEDFRKVLDYYEYDKEDESIFFETTYYDKPVAVTPVYNAILYLFSLEYNLCFEDVCMNYDFFNEDISCYGYYDKIK